MIPFIPFPKIPRLNRGCTITEKIDGTNAQIFIDHDKVASLTLEEAGCVAVVDDTLLYAGSRTRWVNTTDKHTDNYGFAAWVKANAEALSKLGPGSHFGEWWGVGIQRNYGLP